MKHRRHLGGGVGSRTGVGHAERERHAHRRVEQILGRRRELVQQIQPELVGAGDETLVVRGRDVGGRVVGQTRTLFLEAGGLALVIVRAPARHGQSERHPDADVPPNPTDE